MSDDITESEAEVVQTDSKRRCRVSTGAPIMLTRGQAKRQKNLQDHLPVAPSRKLSKACARLADFNKGP